MFVVVVYVGTMNRWFSLVARWLLDGCSMVISLNQWWCVARPMVLTYQLASLRLVPCAPLHLWSASQMPVYRAVNRHVL